MQEGDFKKMRHEHHFKKQEGGTLMIDKFYFESPFGILGKFVDSLYLKNYMTRLLQKRNEEIKNIAEANRWKQFVNQ